MSDPAVTVVVPTLARDPLFLDCLRSLAAQTWNDFEVLVVDNSGTRAARRMHAEAGEPCRVRWVEPGCNTGFGAAINAAREHSRSPYVATLNDDAAAAPGWLQSLVEAMSADRRAGMCACQVRLAETQALDSAGMLIAGDGSSKQRGHGSPPEAFAECGEVLFPSGAAALYRRAALDQAGWFDEDFFLYCEDTDLGLRLLRLGWRCLYVPLAVAHHRLSHSAGRASALKAFYVERNRLFVVAKNFPLRLLVLAPLVTAARYFWHVAWMFRGRGAAAQFRRQGDSALQLGWLALRAHLALVRHVPSLWRKRRQIQRAVDAEPQALSSGPFCRLLRAWPISAKQVAEL